MRRLAVLFVFLPFLVGSIAVAQPKGSLRGNVGAAFFQSPEVLNTVLNSGVNLGVGAAVRMTEGLEFVLEGSYDRFTFNGDTFGIRAENVSVESDVEGGHLNVQNVTAGLRYTFTNQSDVHPYVAGGVGVYRSVLERITVSQSDQTLPRRTATTNGYHAALGSKFLVNETYNFFFEPRLVIVDTDGSELQTGSSARYVTVRLGVDVRF
jgi:opacity protein-like surface antigen